MALVRQFDWWLLQEVYRGVIQLMRSMQHMTKGGKSSSSFTLRDFLPSKFTSKSFCISRPGVLFQKEHNRCYFRSLRNDAGNCWGSTQSISNQDTMKPYATRFK